jgi:hypothetical protein
MKTPILTALAISACVILTTPARATAAQLPQLETAKAHLKLAAMFDGNAESVTVPGMDNAYNWLSSMIEQTLPEISAGWLASGYVPKDDPSGLTCLSREDSFQTEDYGQSWRYLDDRTYACEWGNQAFMAVIRVTVTEENAHMTWSNTEILELSLANRNAVEIGY